LKKIQDDSRMAINRTLQSSLHVHRKFQLVMCCRSPKISLDEQKHYQDIIQPPSQAIRSVWQHRSSAPLRNKKQHQYIL